MNEDKNVRFGVVGYGGWGRHHTHIIAHSPGAELAFVVNSSGQKPQNDTISCPFFDSLETALHHCDVDVLDIVVPNYLHAEYATMALSKGLHVLLEKPLATSFEDAQRVVSTWEATQQVLYVGYELRLSKLWNKVKSLVDDGSIGNVLWIDMSLERHPFRQGSNGWRWNNSAVGNWMIEEAVHHLDLITWIGSLSGSPKHINAHFPGSPGAMANHCTATMDFDGGVCATYRYCLTAAGHHLVATVYGDAGSIRAEWHGVTDRTRHPTVTISLRQGGRVQDDLVEEPSGELFELEAEIQNMVNCVHGRSVPPMSPYEALENLRLAEKVQQIGEQTGKMGTESSP